MEKGIDYSSIWHVFRIKNSLRNHGSARNNEKLVYVSVANTVSCQKRAYFDITSANFAKLDSEKVHEDQIFSQQDILQFFSGESKD